MTNWIFFMIGWVFGIMIGRSDNTKDRVLLGLFAVCAYKLAIFFT